MDPTPQMILWSLGALFALAYLLKKLDDSSEVFSAWVLRSRKFQEWSEKWAKEQNDKATREAEATRNLIRDFRDEFAARFEDLKDLHATKAEVERWKGRTRTLEALQHAQHGTAVPGDSSSFSHGDHT